MAISRRASEVRGELNDYRMTSWDYRNEREEERESGRGFISHAEGNTWPSELISPTNNFAVPFLTVHRRVRFRYSASPKIVRKISCLYIRPISARAETIFFTGRRIATGENNNISANTPFAVASGENGTDTNENKFQSSTAGLGRGKKAGTSTQKCRWLCGDG